MPGLKSIWGQVLFFAFLKNLIHMHMHKNFIARMKTARLSSAFGMRFYRARQPIYKKSGIVRNLIH